MLPFGIRQYIIISNNTDDFFDLNSFNQLAFHGRIILFCRQHVLESQARIHRSSDLLLFCSEIKNRLDQGAGKLHFRVGRARNSLTSFSLHLFAKSF